MHACIILKHIKKLYPLLTHSESTTSYPQSIKSMFQSVVEIVLENIFYLKMYQDNNFFLKNYFLTSIYQNHSETQKKNYFEAKSSKFVETLVQTQL